ncbi:RHS repeat-associated core domain-containing protein [Streptosporangium sp. NPDC004631]
MTTTSVRAKRAKRRARVPKGALPVDDRTVRPYKGAATSSKKSSEKGRAAKTLTSASDPQVVDLWPLHGAQLGSVTPTLVAYGTAGPSPVRYNFTICRMPEDTNDPGDILQGCLLFPNAVVTSGLLPAEVNSWKVPAGKLAWATSYVWWVSVSAASGGVSTASEKRTFITGARQPTIASQLAARGVNGQEFQQLAGNYTTETVDASVSTTGPPLNVSRSYNSRDVRHDGIFGAGWSTRFDMKIEAEPSTALLVTYPDGRRLRFAPRGDGGFQPPPGMFATLAEVSAGGWKLMDKSSTSYVFNAQGRLTKVVDNRGRIQDLVYGTDGKLTKVVGVGGRSLTFTWSGTRVASVSTDPVNGTALTWTYEYQGEKLTKVCSPLGAAGCTAYTYTSGSLYQGIVQDDEPVGYWRLGEPATGPTPPPSPICSIMPVACQPQPTTEAINLGWGSTTATYTGVTLAQSGALNGSADTSATFSGTSSVALPDHLIPRLSGQLSVETWFKTTSSGIIASASDTSIGGTFAGNGQPLLYVGVDGKLRGQFRVTDTSGVVVSPITSTAAVNNGTWHHVALTASATTQTLYLDGAPVGSLTGAIDHNWLRYATIGNGRTTAAWPSSISVPVGQSAEWGFTGGIDEFAVYDHSLSAADLAKHYAAAQAAPHLLTKVTLPSGRVWMENVYDPATDRIKTHTDANGGTWKIGEPVYAPATGISTVTVTDPKNESLSYEHDAQRGYRLVSQTDQLGKKTGYTYDTGGYVASVTDANQNVTMTTQDKRGNVLTKTMCSAGQSPSDMLFSCALSQRPPEWHAYYLNTGDEFDPRNDRRIAYRDPRSTSGSDNTYATTLEYTSYGDLAKQTSPATPDFPTGRSDTYTYTDGTESATDSGTVPAGLLKSQKNAKNDETIYRYTAAGDLAEQTSPSGLKTAFTYDALGRVLSRKEISQANPGGVTSTLTYDGVGRLLTQTGTGVKNEVTNVIHTARASYTYDADGNRLTETLTDLTGGDPARTTTYTYDGGGRVASVTDPEGGVTHSTWDTVGARVSATDPLGTVSTFAYTKRGEPATRTLKNWTGSPVSPQAAQDVVLESYAYDPGGRLAGKVDAMGRKTSYTYFADNRLSQVIADGARLNGSTTPANVVLEDNVYDAAGNLTTQVTGGGKATVDHVYDAAGRTTSTTFDPATLKRKTAYTYDALGNVISKALTGAGSTRVESTDYVYNALGQVTRQTVENGTVDLVSTWAYDDRGLLTAQTDPRGNASGATAADFTTMLRYDLVGQLVESKAPQVTIEKNGTATANVRPTTKYGYDTAGLRTQIVDAEGRTITSTFDKAGRLTANSSPAYTPPGGSTVIPKISYGYDAASRVTTVTDERGYVTTTQYDALSNPVRVTDPGPSGPGGQWTSEFDLLGEELAAIDPTGARVEATYDDLGRRITETQIERRPITAALTTRLTYDTAGNLTKSVVPGDKTTTYTVNAAGQVKIVTNPLLYTSTFDYDILGRTTKVTDPLDNATEVAYDLAGRQTTAKDLDSTGATVRTFEASYDAAGNPTSTTSAEGHVTARTFDAMGRVTSLVEPVTATKTITTTFGYDATGARTRLTDGRGNATWTTYNTLGLAETIIEPSTTAHPSVADRTWTTGYDATGNPVAALQPGGVRIDRTFDQLGRMTKQTGTGASVTTPERNITYDLTGRTTAIGDYTLEYNDRSLLTKVSKATSPVATYAYDNRGNPTQRIDPTGTATYTWDDANRLATASDPVTGRTWTYGYDDADRLTSQTSTGTVNSQSYSYDAVDRITSHTLKNSGGTQLAKIVYGWDKDDNLTGKTTSGTAGAGTNAYTYDRSGRLISWTAPGGTTADYEWDDAGNRTKAGSKTYVYDERNRLTSGDDVDYTYTPRGTSATETKNGVIKNLTFDAFDRLISDGDTTYGYDALGRLTSRTKGTDQRRYVYSGLENDIAVITDGTGAIQAKYGRDPFGGLLGLQEGGTTTLGVMSDLHGDVVGTFSGTALIDSTAYDPFGQISHQSGTQRSLGYQGEYTDPDTGKVNMRARWYQPGSGAFTSRDGWTLDPSPSIQANRYGYANGSPLTHVDPTGHYPLCLWPWHPACPDVSIKWGNDTPKGPCKGKTDPRPQCRGNELTGSTGSAPDGKNGMKATSGSATTGKNGIKGTIGTAPTGNKNPCYGCGNNGPKSPGPKKPEPKKPEPYKPDFDPNSKEFKDDPNNVTNDRGPGSDRTPQEWTDHTCTYGPCTESYTGHRGVDIIGGGGESDRYCAVCIVGVFTPLIAGIETLAPLVVIPVIAGPVGVIVDTTAPPAPPLNSTDPPKSSECPPGGNSFVPGTRVLIADGTHKPIEDVKVGDQVIAADPESGQVTAEPVTHLIVGEGEKHLVRVIISSLDGPAGKVGDVVATDGHPFWVVNLHRWVTASELLPGMVLRTGAGTYVQITALQKWTAHQRVHNLTVDGSHTYHVVAGDQAVLVHNTNPGCDPLQEHADKVRNLPGTKFASEYTSRSGEKYYGRNRHGREASNPLAEELKKSGHHGGCAEVECLIKAQAQEGPDAIKGGSMSTVHSRNNQMPTSNTADHGLPARPCGRCSTLLGNLDISY